MPKTGENIYKRKDGRWEARIITEYSSDGKAKYKYLYAKTYSEVKEKMIHVHCSIKASANKGEVKEISYEHWLIKWLQAKKVQVKESTYIRYRNIIMSHIIPGLGKYPINKIGTSLMESYVVDKLNNGRLDGNGGLSPKTMSDMMIVIKESFKYAQTFGVRTICCFDGITIKRDIREMRVLSRIEQKQLLSVLFDNFDECKMGVFISLYTGIRIGELCALQWKNISFSEKVIIVEHTIQRLQNDDIDALQKTKLVVTKPKSSASLRSIPLPDFVIEAIRPFAGPPSAYVLSGKREEIIEPRTMQNKFKTYLKAGHIDNANFHSLRHTFATRCVEVGFDIKTLSEILGHSSVKITLDRYVHSSMELKRSNMEKLTPITI